MVMGAVSAAADDDLAPSSPPPSSLFVIIQGVELVTWAFGSNCASTNHNTSSSSSPRQRASASEALSSIQHRACCRLSTGRFIPVVNPSLVWATLVHRYTPPPPPCPTRQSCSCSRISISRLTSFSTSASFNNQPSGATTPLTRIRACSPVHLFIIVVLQSCFYRRRCRT
jgi:hypothetical protein